MPELKILKKYWGYDAFRPMQQDIVRAVLDGKDVLALMPTGGGKSICFQVPAMVMDGICIVVSPLVALMKDQVEHLNDRGIAAVAVFGGMGKREIDILLDNCIYGNIKFLYLSPERLQSDLVRTRITYMNVNLIAIDEAHCISQWGYDFRPPYLLLKAFRDLLPDVPTLALTATATAFVRQDIVEKLGMQKPDIFVQSFARKNLSYVVYDVEDKFERLLRIIRSVRGCGLIYVRNRRETANVAAFLLRNGVSADFYHAGLEKEQRFLKQEAWKQNKIQVMVATNAFGMGIDKPDVRFVVHLDLPESLEAYYQEAGRAGRDLNKSYAIMLTNSADQKILEKRINDQMVTPDEIKKIYHYLGSHFQLAFGAGEGQSFNFHLLAFAKTYKLSAVKVLSALKFLEHAGYIQLSESVGLSSRLMVVVDNESLYRFQIENAGLDAFIKTLLRLYGGMFDQYVKINESEIAAKQGFSYNEVIENLKYLEQQEIVSYLPQTDKPQLTYLLPRQDYLHLDLDLKYIAQRQKIQHTQMKGVINYASLQLCRSMQLLRYFNETDAAKCGVCDVCISEKKREKAEGAREIFEYELVQLLQSDATPFSEILRIEVEADENLKIAWVKELLEAGKIKTDGYLYFL